MEFQLINILKEWGLTPQIVVLAYLLWCNLKAVKENQSKISELLGNLTNRVTVLEVKKNDSTD